MISTFISEHLKRYFKQTIFANIICVYSGEIFETHIPNVYHLIHGVIFETVLMTGHFLFRSLLKVWARIFPRLFQKWWKLVLYI